MRTRKLTKGILVVFASIVVEDPPEYCVAAFGVHLVGDLVGNSNEQVTEPGVAARTIDRKVDRL